MARIVEVFPKADKDLAGIATSIHIRVSGESAVRWMVKLQTAIDDLATSAERHPEADEAAKIGKDLRMRIVGNRSHVYPILFTIIGDRILVHRVRHAAQDYLTEDDL